MLENVPCFSSPSPNDDFVGVGDVKILKRKFNKFTKRHTQQRQAESNKKVLNRLIFCAIKLFIFFNHLARRSGGGQIMREGWGEPQGEKIGKENSKGKMI